MTSEGTTAEEVETTQKKEKHTARQDFIDLLARKFVENATKKAEKPLQQLCENLPSNTEEVRNLPFYNSTLRAIQWQRDNYLVGKYYANQRRSILDGDFSTGYFDTPIHMPYDATALGSVQIIKLGSWFIPSATIQNALLPIVVGLPSGALKETIVHTVANAIPLAQPPLDRAVKSSMLQFMENPHWRQVIKTRTKLIYVM